MSPRPTVVVTGASSGIGRATAQRFSAKGWNVVAAMRDPAHGADLRISDRVEVVPIDLRDPASIQAAAARAIEAFGAVDAWINNAGYGSLGPVEAGSREQVLRQFDVNLFGLIECVQAIAPHFRERRAGTIVNVSSAGGFAASPGFAVYNASKFAVEGLSEGLWYELRALGIAVKLVEPGVVRTDFGQRSLDTWDIAAFPDYEPLMEKVRLMRGKFARNAAPAEAVADAIFKAATDPSDRLRHRVGRDARMTWGTRRWLGDRLQMRIARLWVGL